MSATNSLVKTILGTVVCPARSGIPHWYLFLLLLLLLS